MKPCSRCKKIKPFEEFNKCYDGFTPQCKACRKLHRDSVKEATAKKQKIHREENKEMYSLRKKMYYEKNRESELIKMREYRNSNKESIAITQKQWRIKNKEKKASLDRAYREANKDKINTNKKEWKKNRVQTIESKASETAGGHRRRTTIRGSSDGTVTSEFLVELFKEQDGKCFHCGVDLDLHKKRAIHLDHLVPLSKGGTHTSLNVKWSCSFCNLSKGNKLR